jgi:hypothetical protein
MSPEYPPQAPIMQSGIVRRKRERKAVDALSAEAARRGPHLPILRAAASALTLLYF